MKSLASMSRYKFKDFKILKIRIWRWVFNLALAVIMVLVSIGIAMADDTLSLENLKSQIDTGWVLFTGSLVFFMNAGFAMVESGFCRSENTINVLAKNLIVFCLATVAFWFFGFALMFGQGTPYYGLEGWFLNQGSDYPIWKDTVIPLEAFFFFQLTFAGTAATIVSGAVAERIKFPAFLWFSFFLVGISYPISGHWVWGGGWLQNNLNFYDFAGSTVVHSVGGYAALIGAFLLQPRLGKYEEISALEYDLIQNNPKYAGLITYGWLEKFFGLRKRIVPLGGHNLSIATLGCLILWLGWFGFNAGSTLTLHPKAISHILVATIIAGATGAITATVIAWIYFNKPSLSFIINGILGGCVSITAACAYVSFQSAAWIGIIGGLVVILGTIFLERSYFIDDPVGAIPVHLFCGWWGTLAVGLFSEGKGILSWYEGLTHYPKLGLWVALLNHGNWQDSLSQVFEQVIGIVAIGGLTIVLCFIFWAIIAKVLGGLRVKDEDEKRGLDSSLFNETENLWDNWLKESNQSTIEE